MARSRPRPKRRRRRARAALGKSRVSRGSRAVVSWGTWLVCVVARGRAAGRVSPATKFQRVKHEKHYIDCVAESAKKNKRLGRPIRECLRGCTRFCSFHCGVRPLSREIHFVKIFSLSFFLFLSARQSRDKRTVRLDTPKQPCFDGTLHRHLERKERQQTTQGRDGRTARRHHTGILLQFFSRTTGFRLNFFSRAVKSSFLASS